MKNILFILLLSFFSSYVISQVEEVKPVETIEISTDQDTNGPVMDFDTKTVDYGTIEQNSEPLRSISFTNTGGEPLVIKNARGSCGCTVPIWPKEPIMPGETNVIEVRYATNRLGNINKTIKITTNEGEDPHILKVVGKVLKPEDSEGVPSSQPSMLNEGGN